MHLTTKQLELLRVIGAGNADGQPCDMDEIVDFVRYETTKASLQFSIRALIKHGLIEKLPLVFRRGARRRPIGLTAAGRAYAAPAMVGSADHEDPGVVILDDIE
jgi:hypothetical protein